MSNCNYDFLSAPCFIDKTINTVLPPNEILKYFPNNFSYDYVRNYEFEGRTKLQIKPYECDVETLEKSIVIFLQKHISENHYCSVHTKSKIYYSNNNSDFLEVMLYSNLNDYYLLDDGRTSRPCPTSVKFAIDLHQVYLSKIDLEQHLLELLLKFDLLKNVDKRKVIYEKLPKCVL